ncbi:MAG: alkaline phosphatase, partial [Akkermansiaceae bacterium]
MKIFHPLVITVFSLLPALGERDPIRLTQGPMLGHVTDSSVRVWARTSDPGEFTVKFGKVEGQPTGEVAGKTVISSDNTGALTV